MKKIIYLIVCLITLILFTSCKTSTCHTYDGANKSDRMTRNYNQQYIQKYDGCKIKPKKY